MKIENSQKKGKYYVLTLLFNAATLVGELMAS